MFELGALVQCGPYIGRVIAHYPPATLALVLQDGEQVNAHVSVLDPYHGEFKIMAKAPRKTADEKAADKANKGKGRMPEAVKFCAPGFKAEGEPYAQHALIQGKTLTTYDGVLQYGHPIDDELTACPHFGKLRAALDATKDAATTVTQLDAARIAIKAPKFRTVVPCVADTALVIRNVPDPIVGPLGMEVRDGFEIMRQITDKAGLHVITSSVLMAGKSMIATDNHQIVEFFHGSDFPTLTVPANFIEAVLKIAKAFKGFGFSEGSLTFHFEDDSYVRTQLYQEEWPDVSRALPSDFSTLLGVPDGLYTALGQMRPFIEAGGIWFNEGSISSHASTETGCVIDVPGLRQSPGAGLDAVRLWAMRDKVTYFDYWTDPGRTILYGCEGKLRGTLCNFPFEGGAVRTPPATPEAPAPAAAPTPEAVAPPVTPEAVAPPPLPAPPPSVQAAPAVGSVVTAKGYPATVRAFSPDTLWVWVEWANNYAEWVAVAELLPYVPEYSVPDAVEHVDDDDEYTDHGADDEDEDETTQPLPVVTGGFGPPR